MLLKPALLASASAGIPNYGPPVLEQWSLTPNTINFSVPRSSFGDVSGHFLLLVYSTTGGFPPTSIGGWTFVESAASGSACAYALFYQWSTGPESGNIGTVDNGSAGYVAILRMTGVHASNPIQVVDRTISTTSSPVSPSSVVANNDSLVLRILSADDDDWVTPDTGYPAGTSGLFVQERGTFGPTLGIAHSNFAAGVTGTASWANLAANEETIAATVVLNAKYPTP